MPKKTFTPEQIVGKLRQIEVLVSQGKTVPQACKEAGIVEQTFYRWRKEYGGLQVEQAKKLKELQRENAQLTMPPDGEPLTPAQIATLPRWIDEGAVWPETATGPASDWVALDLPPMRRPM